MTFLWNQIGELGMALGIIALATVFGLGDVDPIKRVVKVPMCRKECQAYAINPFVSGFTCTEKTEDVWNDFLMREVNKSVYNYCGACGSPVSCDKLVYR